MLRMETPPRFEWTKVVESQGLLFHSIDGEPYWDETAYYLFEAREIDEIEAASYRLNEMCLAAAGHMIENGRLGELGIPAPFHEFVARSWEHDEHTIYGRFDLAYDGTGPPRLLEFNADTPTALLEAAVIQWFWFRDLMAPGGAIENDRADEPFDQFNSVHEQLIEAWRRVRREVDGRVVFATIREALEDVMTVTYLRDTATQAGLKTEFLAVKDIGWHAGRRVFTDLRERAVDIIFKLYPWEWMLREPFSRFLTLAPTRWLEPPWKMVLSNKAILPVLYDLFPESPFLLHAGFEPIGESYVSKPIFSREGSNIAIVQDGQTIAETGGDYADGPRVYQEFHPLPAFDDRYPVVGSWMVNGHACGVGIREDDGLITRNTSRFVPHIFRKSPAAKPPVMNPKARAASETGRRPQTSTDTHNPLYDPWLDH
jgi:glutathionylspermidine synthase